ncbi:MAG: aminotransferase class III-fold pyridoxal phosphate-dependent enzyme [Candidatus Omnitrophica bacterium]|nr:aminotransferase class III-fold pyridoxal phosphate-dependent enzyme [Candidatus Omnitrophota bacterium]
MKTPSGHEALLKDESKYCSYGDTVHYNDEIKIFKSCDGSFLYDEQDKAYLDLQMWYSAVNLGYRNRQVVEAVQKQLDTLPQLASSYIHEGKIVLSKQLAERNKAAFGEEGRVHFNVGGSQAIEDSMKLLRKKTGKTKFLAFQGSYHGRTIAATEITASYRYRKNYGHFSNRAHFVPYPYCFRCPYDKKLESCDYYCVKQFEKQFESEAGSFADMKTNECEYAAFYVEAVQGTGGYIFPPADYFKRLKKTLDRFGIYLVDDEIQMGFYRTGKFWSIEHYGVSPDVVVFGKALTNGMNPLSGFWAKENLVNPSQFPAGSTHSTFSSNPMGTAAGVATMNVLNQKELETDLNRRGEEFLGMLKDLQKKYPVIADLDGRGMAFRLEICKPDGITPDPKLTDRIYQDGLKGDLTYKGKQVGLVLDIGGHYKNVFTLSPSFFMSRDEMVMAYELMDQLFQRHTF